MPKAKDIDIDYLVGLIDKDIYQEGKHLQPSQAILVVGIALINEIRSGVPICQNHDLQPFEVSARE